MAYRSNNLVTGRQLRAARTLPGMTQRDLATVCSESNDVDPLGDRSAGDGIETFLGHGGSPFELQHIDGGELDELALGGSFSARCDPVR